MNPNLIKTSTKNMTDEAWLQFRQGGIGGSEIGTVMLQNDFDSRLELYHRKIGVAPLEKTTSEAMHWGNEHEHTIATNWQYYDGSIEGMIKRKHQGKESIYRKCRKVNHMVRNPKYPALLANVDRLINKSQIMIYSGQLLTKEAILEIKTVREWAMKMWEAGVPNAYILQMMAYMGVCELEYAELAVLMSNAHLEIIPIEFSQELFDNILAEVNPFWERILKGRFLMHQYQIAEKNGDAGDMLRLQMELDANEPEATEEDAVQREQYLNKRFLAVPEVIAGTEEILEAGRHYKRIADRMKGLEEKKAFHGSIIKNYMKTATMIDFGHDGSITWNANKNGVRSLNLNKLVA